jgi:hypothetical protein
MVIKRSMAPGFAGIENELAHPRQLRRRPARILTWLLDHA